MDTVTAMYTCQACGDEKVKVKVRKRYPNEDIIAFTKATAQALGDVHLIRNPMCSCRKIDVYMPIAEEGIGMGEEKPT